MPQFPWQEGLCLLLPTVPVPGVSLQCSPGKRGGDGSGAVRSLAPWASLLPELGHPAWAAPQGGLCARVGGDGGCADVRGHTRMSSSHVPCHQWLPSCAVKGLTHPRPGTALGGSGPAALLGPLISVEGPVCRVRPGHPVPQVPCVHIFPRCSVPQFPLASSFPPVFLTPLPAGPCKM